MQEDKHHISFSAEDIRRYHEGRLTSRQMHEMEKAALEDPFLADALEGYAVDEVRLPADTDELNKRLQERIEDKKVIPMIAPARSFRWMRVAAMIVAVTGAGLLAYKFGFDDGRNKVIAEQKVQQPASTASTNTDSTAGQDLARSSATKWRADSVAAATSHSETVRARAATEKKNEANELVANGKTEPATEDRVASVAAPSAARPYLAEEKKINPETDSRQTDNDALAKALTGRAAGLETTRQENARQSAMKAKRDSADNANRSFLAAEPAKKSADGYNSYGFTREQAQKLEDLQALPRARKATEQNLRPTPNVFRGKVTDNQNNPLPFANITNNQDKVGTYADAQGNFILTSPDSVMNVQVRSLGFENTNVQLQNGLTMNRVALKDDHSVPAIVLSNKKINAKLRENSMVLEEPEPADGWTKYDAYLANNLKLPDDYKGGQNQGGEVELSFEVNQLGEPVNIKVEKSLCEVCDKEAIRLLKEGPKWKKKVKKGKRTSITIPF